MNDVKQMAVDVMDELHRTIQYEDYCTVMDGLQEIETLQERDEELEEMWASFTDVPMNPETECIEEKFIGWEPGTSREEIWHWFDERHSKGVTYLLYGVPFYEKDPNQVHPLREFVKQEVPFRLSEIFHIPDSVLAPQIVDACINDLYDNSDVMFDYNSMDDHLREVLKEYDIDPDDYEEEEENDEV